MSGSFGRLASGPNPVLHQILYAPHLEEDRHQVLPHLLAIDAAHLVMLTERGVLPASTTAEVLKENRELVGRLAAGEEVLPAGSSHRGLYLLYEQHLLARLGPEKGGAGHVGRSRNDLNATVARMRARTTIGALLERGNALLATILEVAGRHAGTLTPGFTHFQPAQPSTLGHYLAGIGSELVRGLEQLQTVRVRTNQCPMGAAAGFGTSIPIDPARVAQLLGFDSPLENSLDAVASRDYVLDALGAMARLGVLLTRLANDFQHWASRAYNFLDWPDEFVSTSSIMPQKRNAFVLENIRGLAAWPAGCFQVAIVATKGTPFTNGIEAGTEAVRPLWSGSEALDGALRLTELLLANVRVDAGRALASMAGTDIVATAIADMLVLTHRLPFRSAHEVVASIVALGFSDPAGISRALEQSILERLGAAVSIPPDDVERCLAIDRCVAAAEYGGGPAPDAVRQQLSRLAIRAASVARSVADFETALRVGSDALDRAAHQPQGSDPR